MATEESKPTPPEKPTPSTTPTPTLPSNPTPAKESNRSLQARIGDVLNKGEGQFAKPFINQILQPTPADTTGGQTSSGQNTTE